MPIGSRFAFTPTLHPSPIMRRSLLPGVLLAFGLIAVTPVDAYAYVDPGTGSYLFQLAAAGLLAGMFTVRRFWDAMKSWFASPPASSEPKLPPTNDLD